MKTIHKSIWLGTLTLLISLMLAVPLTALAEDDQDTVAADADVTQTFSEEQLAQMLAPIALYPDELITQVLLASTYPLEIVMADRWVKQHKDLKGEELAAALEQETWDPSVKALVNFPTVLDMLNQKLDLTTKLGDAFLDQKEDVMNMIQELRKRAADAGNLQSTGEQNVVVKDDAIIIEPANDRVIYVPTYDPYLVYGPWWYPGYPPYYFYPPPSGVIFSFGVGVTLGLPWGYAWGGWDWYNHNVYINVYRHRTYNRYIDRSRYIRNYERRGVPIRSGTVTWQHDPGHRRGVAYRDMGTARRFGQLPARRSVMQPESRGFSTPATRIDRGTRSGTGATGTTIRRSVTAPAPAPAPSTAPATSAPPARTEIRGTERKTIRTETQSDSRVTVPKATRESVFTGTDSDATRTRRSSERGGQSIGSGAFRGGGAAARPGGERSGGSVPRRGGDQGDDRRR